MTLIATSYASAEEAPLRVSVDGSFYRISGNVISTEDVGQRLDALQSRKASFAAQVLDHEILHSDYAARLFSPETRASVLSSVASGRLIEPWRRALNAAGATPGTSDIANAAENFKAWAVKLAADPKQLMLAAVRKTYSDGAAAYQENAAIYRSVVKRNETLSYDAAVQFLGNEMATRRLAVAFEIEKYLNNGSPIQPASAKGDSDELTRVRQLIQTEVLDKAPTGLKSPDDLWSAYGKITRIAENEQATLRSFLGTVKPAIVRFTFTGSNGGEAVRQAPGGSIVTKFSGQNAVTIAVPVTSPVNPRVNITGGILPPPSGIAAPVQANRSEASPPGRGNTDVRSNAANAGNNGAAPGGSPAADASARTDAGGGTLASNSDPAIAVPGDVDNLKTYSSKPYHNADGMVFNPLNGMWENPADASDYRIPTVITCCDDTGLAFPNDAIEAQQDYWWDGGGTDPNCGRLYDCGTVTDSGGTVPPVDASGPTDRDAEILKALEFFDTLSLDDRNLGAWEFVKSLPRAYRMRAFILRRQHNASRNGAQRAPAQAARGYSSADYSGRNGVNRVSTVTGVGGSGGSVASNYTPVTQSTAQTIVGKYKSIPGGVTLEGGSPDLAFIKSVSYLPGANAFLLNNDVVYLNPVSSKDFAEIYRATLADDNMGVSLGLSAIVYGKLPPQGDVAGNLELADRFLGSITFGSQILTKGYIFAQNYLPKTLPPDTKTKPLAVYFNLHDLTFREEADGHLVRRGVSLDTTVVPLAAKEGGDGGHLPDLDRIKSGDVPPAYVANLKHLQDNISYYARERIVRRALAYAEVAAFSRELKTKRVTVDLASFNESIDSEKPAASTPVAPSSEGCALAAVHWSSTESIGTREAYRDHLARFPTCTFATLAAARIAALDATTETPSHPTPPKACGSGQTLSVDGKCVSEKTTTTAPRRQSRRATTTAPSERPSGGALDCNGPIGFVGCVGHALNKH